MIEFNFNKQTTSCDYLEGNSVIMAHFDPSELDGNSDYKMSGGDDEKKMANDLNLGFNEV